MCPPDLWEQGSDFHLEIESGTETGTLPWGESVLLFGSGRDALRALLEHGALVRGWKRLWIPSYFCQDVLPTLFSSKLAVLTYPDNPLDDGTAWEDASLRSGDVVLRVNYLGLRSLDAPLREDLPEVEFIDDHTHDPLSTSARSSVADWCVASLRKTVPLPDGGGLWSPTGHALPASYTESAEHRVCAMRKLAAMALKAAYLAGGDVPKAAFRDLFQTSEAGIGVGPVSGISSWSRSMLGRLPISRWRDVRRENYDTLAQALGDVGGITLLRPRDGDGTCPLAVAIVCDTVPLQRSIKQALIDARVYPAVLWPLDEPFVEGIRECDLDLSRRILCLHCDMRYDSVDMLRVASLVRKASAATVANRI